jgi:hypothetical protein
VDTERQAGTGGSVPPLTRADVERPRSKVERSKRCGLGLPITSVISTIGMNQKRDVAMSHPYLFLYWSAS